MLIGTALGSFCSSLKHWPLPKPGSEGMHLGRFVFSRMVPYNLVS